MSKYLNRYESITLGPEDGARDHPTRFSPSRPAMPPRAKRGHLLFDRAHTTYTCLYRDFVWTHGRVCAFGIYGSRYIMLLKSTIVRSKTRLRTNARASRGRMSYRFFIFLFFFLFIYPRHSVRYRRRRGCRLYTVELLQRPSVRISMYIYIYMTHTIYRYVQATRIIVQSITGDDCDRYAARSVHTTRGPDSTTEIVMENYLYKRPFFTRSDSTYCFVLNGRMKTCSAGSE